MEQKKRTVVKYTNEEVKISEEAIPSIPEGQVLIKTAFATINPVDLATMALVRTEGYINGIEGSGVIIKVGENVSQNLIGKKVCFAQEAWATHTIRPLKVCMILDDSQDLKAATPGLINPLTACGQLDYAKKNGVSAVIMTAASSTLAKQFFKLCKKEGIKVINVVRKDEYVTELKQDLGANYVLNQKSPYFEVEASQMIKELRPTLIYEYVGGELGGQLFRMMPRYSIMMTVGNLTQQPLLLDSGSMIYHVKKIVSFNIFDWIQSTPSDEIAEYMKIISNDLKEGGAIFGTKITKIVRLEEWNDAVEVIHQAAGQGKVLLSCD